MKMTKKKVLALALCLCLLATVAAGSLAWFSAEDSVTNQFLIADSTGDDKADFSVDVKESEDDGTNWSDNGLTYEDILPGQTLPKLAKVINTSTGDTYSQYIRVTVTLTGMNWQAAGEGDFTKSLTGLNADLHLVATDYDNTTQTNTAVFYLNKELAPGDEVTAFEGIKIPGKFDNQGGEFNLTNFDLTVKAEAVQSEFILDESVTYANVWQEAQAAFEAANMKHPLES